MVKLETLSHIYEASLSSCLAKLLRRHFSHAFHILLIEDKEPTSVSCFSIVKCLILEHLTSLIPFCLFHRA